MLLFLVMRPSGPSRARSTRPTRTYTSPRRQQQAADTRATVLEAARTLFSERGWTGTSMRDVAAHAGVSVETIYALFGSKPDLLQAALETSVVGDQLPAPVADRREFLAMAEGSILDRIRASLRLTGRAHRDAAGLHRALRQAAASDPNLGQLLAKNEERRKEDVAVGFGLVTGRRPTPTERDGAWALSSFEVYDLLVERSGWSLRHYEEWLAGLMSLALLGPTDAEEDRPGPVQGPGSTTTKRGTS